MLAAAYDLARPLLFRLDPERAHDLILAALEAGLYPRPALILCWLPKTSRDHPAHPTEG
jgi:hypothetical protein